MATHKSGFLRDMRHITPFIAYQRPISEPLVERTFFRITSARPAVCMPPAIMIRQLKRLAKIMETNP